MGDQFSTYSKVFGYSKEDMEMILKPMAVTGDEPTSSMGNDTPLACFSEKPQRFFNYFRQVFAQVTNPPIDSIREGLVMSLTNYIGSLVSNIALAVLLILIGVLLYKESINIQKIIGIGLCLTGLILINK